MGRSRARIASLFAAAALLACDDRERTPLSSGAPIGSEPRSGDGRVVLVTVDGVRWQDVFEGSNPAFGAPALGPDQLMPRTHALVARGVAIGATLPGCGTMHTAGNTNVSLPGYQEIFTGHASNCLDNACAHVGWTVLDEAAHRGVPGVASIASWPVLAAAVSRSGDGVLVSAGRNAGAELPVSGALGALVAAGDAAGPFPGNGGYRPDAYTAALALDYLRARAPAFLHVGLGDTDEWGHKSDYGAYLSALRAADAFIGEVADALDAMGDVGARTTVLVTADHGREAAFTNHGPLAPESGRTWLVAFGGDVPARGVVCPATDVTLADIAPTIRVILGLPADPTDGAGAPIDDLVSPPPLE